MSKRLKNIEVEVNERKGLSHPAWEVVIPGKQTIGVIENLTTRFRVTIAKDKQILYSKSLESAINDLLSYFALHEK